MNGLSMEAQFAHAAFCSQVDDPALTKDHLRSMLKIQNQRFLAYEAQLKLILQDRNTTLLETCDELASLIDHQRTMLVIAKGDLKRAHLLNLMMVRCWLQNDVENSV